MSLYPNLSSKIRFIITFSLFPFMLYAQKQKSKPQFSEIENNIIDTVEKLKIVQERMKYVEADSKGKRHLQFTIWEKPTKQTPYYWVKVMEDNGISYYTHFNFYVYPGTMKIKFLDTVNDRLIDADKIKSEE
jgi:hypothetical protein